LTAPASNWGFNPDSHCRVHGAPDCIRTGCAARAGSL